MRNLDRLGVKRPRCLGEEEQMSGSRRKIAWAALLTLALVLATIADGGAGQSIPPPTISPASEDQRASLLQVYGKLPFSFIENQGQMDSRARFYAQASGGTLFFTDEGIVFTLHPGSKKREPLPQGELTGRKAESGPRTVVQWKMAGLSPGAKLLPLHPQEGKVHYFLGNDPQNWHTNLPTYQALLYQEAYPGIDLKFYGTGPQLEYDILVQPGADPSLVKFQYEGIQGLQVSPEGDLVILLSEGQQVLQKKPVVYQEIGGERVLREGTFQLYAESPGLYSFALGPYDPAYPLAIDPVLLYSTYLGGSLEDKGYGIAVDSAGNAYVTGQTYSSNFPIQNPLQSGNKGGFDVIVAKLNPSGSALVYSTYLGGSSGEGSNGIAVDSAGNAYVVGYTGSSHFPTQNPLQPPYMGGFSDTFVAKLNPNGSALVYSTYLGESVYDYGVGIAVDSAGNAYVTGYTNSSDFPTENPLQLQYGGEDPTPSWPSSLPLAPPWFTPPIWEGW